MGLFLLFSVVVKFVIKTECDPFSYFYTFPCIK